jgi:hypothetical protein
VEVLRSPRTFLSYWGPDSLSVVEREITGSPVPVLLMRADGDEFTPDAWSVAVNAAAQSAGVDSTYEVIPYPGDVFNRLENNGVNAHGFAGVERELIARTIAWLTARAPEADEFTTTISHPASSGGNYLPYADAGPDILAQVGAATLNGRRSQDIDGTLAYQWIQTDGSALQIDDPTSATPTVTATAFGVQTASFQLTVTDTAGASASDDVNVTIDGGTEPVIDEPDTSGNRNSSGGSSLDLMALLALALAAARRR